jgi:hypothetical protein
MGEPDRDDPATILVVDDLPQNIRLVAAVLEPRGYEVVPATSGPAALARIQSDPPDLVTEHLDGGDLNQPHRNASSVSGEERGDLVRVHPVVAAFVSFGRDLAATDGNEDLRSRYPGGAHRFRHLDPLGHTLMVPLLRFPSGLRPADAIVDVW